MARGIPSVRECARCECRITRRWHKGPDGPNTLCNTCGYRHLRGWVPIFETIDGRVTARPTPGAQLIHAPPRRVLQSRIANRQRKENPFGRCTYCHRNETPHWRCGPHGYFTLCNTCGVSWTGGDIPMHPKPPLKEVSSSSAANDRPLGNRAEVSPHHGPIAPPQHDEKPPRSPQSPPRTPSPPRTLSPPRTPSPPPSFPCTPPRTPPSMQPLIRSPHRAASIPPSARQSLPVSPVLRSFHDTTAPVLVASTVVENENATGQVETDTASPRSAPSPPLPTRQPIIIARCVHCEVRCAQSAMLDGPDGPATLCDDCGHDYRFGILPLRHDGIGNLTARKIHRRFSEPPPDMPAATAVTARDREPPVTTNMPSMLRPPFSPGSEAEEVLDEGSADRTYGRRWKYADNRLAASSKHANLPFRSVSGEASTTIPVTASTAGLGKHVPTTARPRQFMRRKTYVAVEKPVDEIEPVLRKKVTSSQIEQMLPATNGKRATSCVAHPVKKARIGIAPGTEVIMPNSNRIRPFVKRMQRPISQQMAADPAKAQQLNDSNDMPINIERPEPNHQTEAATSTISTERPEHAPAFKLECKEENVEVVSVAPNASCSISIKAALGDCFRRFSISGESTYPSLLREVGRVFQTKRNLAVSYIDDEGDSITLSSDLELKEMLRMVRERESNLSLVRLNLTYLDEDR